ncbi:MAG TPA: UDP-N-acetylmuramate:L-alanyl-gamma-D-glutamyl-meso-diaminopimelate ligase [Gammaproteobacteria bacterium]|nr:UDP-N-acetylmuramate:L-alanyl-gamma-D-glutamyl-meso-diaminopimelate ligase [Gammaproteobacteria bacterium]
MRIHILGICGTFMAGVAVLARAAGHEVSGSDANVYPPMSTLLAEAGIPVHEGYRPEHLNPAPDCVVIGNALSRGNPAVEHVLERGLPYASGPQWLADHVLAGRWVLAVAGTHGKTTTSAMLAWILDSAGLAPGFLIGGVLENFDTSARLGDMPFFVVEADEYDTAFFDKRSKFVHYRPRTLVINNLEYDHADIFPDLAAIETQFHHLVRTVPGNGLIVAPADDPNVDVVLERGCWTPIERFRASDAASEQGWSARDIEPGGGAFTMCLDGAPVGRIQWDLLGPHNVRNALAAIAAARHAGVPPNQAIEALAGFRNVKRRLQVRGAVDDIVVYDDFAHHPTAIRSTLAGLRGRVGGARILAVLEPRSNTMRLGVHRDSLAGSLEDADEVFVFRPADLDWDLKAALASLGNRVQVFDDVGAIVETVAAAARPGDHVLIMSNGGFEDIHARLLDALETRAAAGRAEGATGS